MNDWQTRQDRERQVRRTTSARRGLVAVGAVGALGTAMAIGVGQVTRSSQGTDDGSGFAQQNSQRAQQPTPRSDDGEFGDGEFGDDDGQQPQFQNPPPQQGGQLVTPGNGGPAQGQSGGS